MESTQSTLLEVSPPQREPVTDEVVPPLDEHVTIIEPRTGWRLVD
jgi:hypothetical protein